MFGIALLFVLADALRLGGGLPAPEAGGGRRILDRYGREISHALTLEGERRYVVPLDAVPEPLRRAFVLAEDRRFYEHRGVDWRAIIRGALLSLKNLRKVSGGSTITMQLVRIHWPELRGVLHKPAQILQALRLEWSHSKGELLANYLNTVPFGGRISGVGAACRYFFEKSCPELSPAQMAALAILPRNPAVFSQGTLPLKRRRDALLGRLLAGADPLVLEQARNEPLALARAGLEFHAAHLTERILDERPEGVVRTTIDLELQKGIEALLAAETLRRRGTGDSGAALVLDNRTGEVLAYVGSPDFLDPAHGMVDGVHVLRSPGSALKPFVYELALENGWDLFSILPDIPMVFSTRRAVYEPNNYGGDFSGPRTLRDALGNSKNLPALFMTSKLGEARVLDRLRKLGFDSLKMEAAFYGIGLSLGNGEVSLWELTQAYSTLGRLGVAIPATYYRDRPARPSRVVAEDAAFLIADVLRDPEARQEEFGRGGPLEFEYEVGVKTGTSSDYRDNWTVGFTRDVTVGIWRGNADSTPLAQRVSASRGTGPLFHRIMDLVHAYRGPAWLRPPAGLERTRVCALSGRKPGPHCTATRLEYHLAGHAPEHLCEYHRAVKVPDCRGESREIVYVQYPKEYDEWARSSHTPTLENQLREKCGGDRVRRLARTAEGEPEIVEPLDRTTYALDPTIPAAHQALRLLLRNAARGARVYVNDEPFGAPDADQELFWPLRRGKFRFTVKNGGRTSNAVTIQVL